MLSKEEETLLSEGRFKALNWYIQCICIYAGVDVWVWNCGFTFNEDKAYTPGAYLLALFQESGDVSSILS